MTVPTDATKEFLDDGANDTPAQALAELEAIVDKLNTTLAHLRTSTITSGSSVLSIGDGLQSSGGNLVVNFGTGIGQAVQLENVGGSAGLPAVDGSQLTGISAGALTSTFTSTEQTITSAGLLTLAHGLSAKPSLIRAYLVNKTAELGYAVGAEMEIDIGPMSVNGDGNTGIAVSTIDDTNILVTYGAATNVFYALNRGLGVISACTNANWRLVIKAWV